VKYLMLINQPEAREWQNLSPEQRKSIAEGYQALVETPGVTPAPGRLHPPEMATTVRVQNGTTLTTDGPFVELKEAIDGWFIYEGDDLDAAIEVASKVPAASMGGAIEIRPMMGG
jgi:hypothetical protein